MKRSEQARMLIGLTIPGRGPVAWSAATPPAAVPLARRWFDAMERQRRAESLSSTDCLEGIRAAYFLTLFACAGLFGLFVGGYAGFMENATPHAEPPRSFAQPAAPDVAWAARMRQDWLAARPPEFVAAGQHMRETRWQRLFESTATDSGSVGTPSPTMLGGHFVRLDAPSADSVPHHPNHEAELSERTSSRTVTDR